MLLGMSRAKIKAYIAKGGQLCVSGGGVLGGIVGEDCDAIEGAVVLWVVQPALQAMRTLAPDANANNVRRTAIQTQKCEGTALRL